MAECKPPTPYEVQELLDEFEVLMRWARERDDWESHSELNLCRYTIKMMQGDVGGDAVVSHLRWEQTEKQQAWGKKHPAATPEAARADD